MKILIAGSTGLIGSVLVERLRVEGHDVICVRRRETRSYESNDPHNVVLDIAKAIQPEHWIQQLKNVDVVINCAGALQESANDDLQAVHSDGVSALFKACEIAGVGKVIHFSAMGVDSNRPTPFSASKWDGDQSLMALDLNWVILRPSVVLA